MNVTTALLAAATVAVPIGRARLAPPRGFGADALGTMAAGAYPDAGFAY